jgi:hypothetical protein
MNEYRCVPLTQYTKSIQPLQVFCIVKTVLSLTTGTYFKPTGSLSGTKVQTCKNTAVEMFTILIHIYFGARGGVVVKAIRYKPTGRGFDSRWCYWNFSVTQSFRSHYGSGVDSASNRNEYQVYFLGVMAAGA